jgi:hypothetical protein
MADQPSRTSLKRVLLYAARHFLPGERFHSGAVQVTVAVLGESDSAVLVADQNADGLTAPSGVDLAPTDSGPEPSGPGPSHADLLRHFLCDDERTMLRALVAAQPCHASHVLDAIRGSVGKAAFWPLWKSLQVRGLVDERADGLFQVAFDWVGAIAAAG